KTREAGMIAQIHRLREDLRCALVLMVENEPLAKGPDRGTRRGRDLTSGTKIAPGSFEVAQGQPQFRSPYARRFRRRIGGNGGIEIAARDIRTAVAHGGDDAQSGQRV